MIFENVLFPCIDRNVNIVAKNNLIQIQRIGKVSQADWVALPLMHNYHAHADRAFSASNIKLNSMSLDDAIFHSDEIRQRFTTSDVKNRAYKLFCRSLEHGVSFIRTHTDVDEIVELRSINGVLQAKEEIGERLAIEIVAFATSSSDVNLQKTQDRIREAVNLDADIIGGAPAFSDEPLKSIDALLDLAEQLDKPVDLHLDEHLEEENLLAAYLSKQVLERGMLGRVTISHLCVSSALDDYKLKYLLDLLRRAEITVVTLPETNLFLSDRRRTTPRRRGVATIREMLQSGISVRLGTDNVQDWFYPFGNGDLLQTSLIAALGIHLDDENTLVDLISGGNRHINPVNPKNMVLIPACSFVDALSRTPDNRVKIQNSVVYLPRNQ